MSFKYTGDLAKAIPRPALGLLMPPEQIATTLKEFKREKYRRMVQLFDAYEIAHGNWEQLCFSLAEAHVPGLRVGVKPGKKTKWDDTLRAELVLAVEQTGIENITSAIEKLAAIEPWKSLVSHTKGAETLRGEYNRRDPRWVELVRKARAYDALSGEER